MLEAEKEQKQIVSKREVKNETEDSRKREEV